MGKEEGSLPMVGGYGENSYLRNSSYQRKMFESIKEMIADAVQAKLDLSTVNGPLRIADLGCAVGPNTFYAVQSIVDALMAATNELQPAPNPRDHHQNPSLEFQVFFNDQVDNDFNVLLSTLPADRPYFAAAVPGSFHSRLFPRDSVHVFNSSVSLHWLSRAPQGLPGRVHIYGGGGSSPIVRKAYLQQFMSDMDGFLRARAEELVVGGLLAVLIGCHVETSAGAVTPTEEIYGSIVGPIFEKLLLQGEVKEEDVDSFRFPVYLPTVEEFKEAVDSNGRYTIHVAEVVKPQEWWSDGARKETADLEQSSRAIATTWRAASEGHFKRHFGERVGDQILEMIPGQLRSHLATHGAGNLSPSLALFILQRKIKP